MMAVCKGDGQVRSVRSVGSMACDALRGDVRQGADGLRNVSVGSRFLRDEREPTGRPVHLCADVLHGLGHEACHVRGAVGFERRQADSSFGHFASVLVPARAEGTLYLGDRHQMVPHIGEHVLHHRGRQFDELPRINGLDGRADAACSDHDREEDGFLHWAGSQAGAATGGARFEPGGGRGPAGLFMHRVRRR